MYKHADAIGVDENVSISADEVDVINTQFDVYLARVVDNDGKIIGPKLLYQCYGTIRNDSRTTGSSSFYVERDSINIFGASTGSMLASVF
ncbi:unnamed protein product [Rotaria socialis]|uniref:Uncharacterized protein n=1 Tax=Rotaria socialis TaxID=392032 RepID=A0A821P6C0_9BILA|nr:unnamed protein product [Rotaria socialis]